MKINTTQAATTRNTETEIETIDVAQLDDITGGCAACGNANCQPTTPNAQGTNPIAALGR